MNTSTTDTPETAQPLRPPGAETHQKGPRCGTSRHVAPAKSQVGQEGQPGRRKRPKGAKKRRRRPRGQQDGQGPGPAEAAGRSHGQGTDESHRLAAAFRSRLPVRHDRQEDGPDRHSDQGRGRGAQLFGQGLIATIGTRFIRAAGVPPRRLFSSVASALQRSIHAASLRRSLRDLVERPPVAVQDRLLAGVLLIAPHDAVGVLRIDLHQPRLAAAALAPDQRRARAAEQVRDDVAGLAAVQQRALDQFDRLRGRVNPIRRGLLLLPQRRLRFVAVPGILLAGDVGSRRSARAGTCSGRSPRRTCSSPR